MTEDDWRKDALSWVGRRVKIIDGPSVEHGAHEIGTVICVDATDYRPSAWVKIGDREGRRSYPSYRSCDLCWLEDLETADTGAVWCSSPNSDGHGELDADVVAERIGSVSALAAGSRRAKTPKAVECEASQSGGAESDVTPEHNTPPMMREED